jgi:heptosyltransferase-2
MGERLVVFAPNWLGDAVMALPAIESLRLGRPDASIDVAVRPSVAPLFSLVPHLGVTRLDRGAEVSTLRQHRYDAALLLPNSFNAARIAYRAGIGERWGYAAGFRSWLLTRAVPPRTRLHQVESYRHLARALGFPDGPSEPRLSVPDAVREEGAARLRAEGWEATGRLVALAPGAAFGTAKRWPAASFAALIDRYTAQGVQTLMVGSQADAPAGRAVVAAVRGAGRPIDLIGRTDLRALAAVLIHAQALVTNDSGAMHVAAALGLDVTAIFGPTIEKETHPVGRGRASVLTAPVWCRPCMLRECPLTHRCMRGITVDAVFDATKS